MMHPLEQYNLVLKSYLVLRSFKQPLQFSTLFFLTTVLIIFVAANSNRAQVKNSIYSMFGVGQLNDNSFGINRSLGGTGIALQSGRSINYLNPASYLGIFPGSFNTEIGVYGIYNKSKNKNTFQTDEDVKFSYFSTGFYFAEWWASVFGIAPFSSVDYEINSSGEISGELTSFEKNYTGTGGLNKIFWGNSFKVYGGLSIGFNASYIFGHIIQTETADSEGTFTGYKLKNDRTARSFYFDYGLQYSNYLIDEETGWLYTIGFVYGAAKKLNTIDETEFTYNNATNSLDQDKSLDIKIPQKLGLGISVKRNNFRTGFDYEWGNWSNINFSNPNLKTKDSKRYSIGVEYSPSDRTNENWIMSLLYRAGANYKNSYLEIDNTPINSIGISLGIGIPYDKINTINLTLEYGEEGTLNKGLIKNTYWILYLNISMYEFWSVIASHD